MGILNVGLNNINLDDVSFDEDGPETLFHVRLMDYHNWFKQRKAFNPKLGGLFRVLLWGEGEELPAMSEIR